jgi:hypothetical protein
MWELCFYELPWCNPGFHQANSLYDVKL